MRHYLSMGGGVNSIALDLLMTDLGYDFEAVFADTGCEWPHTYHYLAMFQWWKKSQGLRPIKILKPTVNKTNTLIENCKKYSIVPQRKPRWCTKRWKSDVLLKYQKPPAFVHIGFAYDEKKRADNRQAVDGYESRFLLIEHKITRAGCIEIIKNHGLAIPEKSGCYICPNQRVGQWRNLRRYHPELFCEALRIENANIEYRKMRGKKPMYISSKKIPLLELVDERQGALFDDDEYPPCLCGL